MAKLIYIAAIFLAIALVSAGDDSEDSGDATSGTTEGKAGEAIKSLLQEKITQKFKEAANEVKGVLVKQLGDSLKSAHDVFNPPKEKAKTNAATAAKVQGKQGAAAIHQNKANRHRKNSGPQGTPQKPPIEAKGGAPIPLEGKGPGPMAQEAKGPGPLPQEAKGPGPMPPAPPPCAPAPPCGLPPMDMMCCDQQNPHQQMPMAMPMPMPPPQMPPMAPPPPMNCAPGPCQQTCGPACAPQQCCPGKRGKISHKGKKNLKKE